jgi:hypothetical protein
MSATMNGLTPIANPLVLAERLVALAIDADRSGFPAAARRLIATAHEVLDRPGLAAQPASHSRQWVSLPGAETGDAPPEAVGIPARTATIHPLRFGIDAQRDARDTLGMAGSERLAIKRLSAAH